MKLRLIRFALWSLQSRDEGVDKEGAKRWRAKKKERGRGLSEESDMRQDMKMGANRWNEIWEGRMKDTWGGFTLQKGRKKQGTFAWKR